jgi:hypothetical protein
MKQQYKNSKSSSQTVVQKSQPPFSPFIYATSAGISQLDFGMMMTTSSCLTPVSHFISQIEQEKYSTTRR